MPVEPTPDHHPEIPSADPLAKAREILRQVSAYPDISVYLSYPPPFDYTRKEAKKTIKNDLLVIGKSLDNIGLQLATLKRLGIRQPGATLITILAPHHLVEPESRTADSEDMTRRVLDTRYRPSGPLITQVLRGFGALQNHDTLVDIYRLIDDFRHPAKAGRLENILQGWQKTLFAPSDSSDFLRTPRSEEARKKILGVQFRQGFGVIARLPCTLADCGLELRMNAFTNGDIDLSVKPSVMDRIISQYPRP